MAQFFINRPIFAWVIALFILVMGGVAITQLPISQYPRVAPPSIVISAAYPGASAKTLEDSVISVIEREMNGSPGLIYMESTSQANGSGSITLSFETGTNAELAQAKNVLSFLQAAETRVVSFGPEEPKPRGRVLLNPSRGVLLIASNLPPAPAGRIYEMWIIPKGGAPIPAGLFQTTAAGNALHLQEGALGLDSTIAVTLEPEAGSAAPTTTPLFAAGV